MAALLGAASLAHATDTRRTALAESYLYVDDSDLFLYPGMIGEWSRFLFVNANANSGDVDAGILLGAGPVVGIVFDRPTLWNDIARMDALYDAMAAQQPVRHVMDLALGFPSGDTGFGLLLGWGTGVVDVAGEDPADEGELLSTGSQANVIDVGAGWSSHPEGGARVDLGLGLTENLYEQSEAGDVTVRSSKAPGVHFVGRFLLPMGGSLDLGIEALVTRRHYGITVLPDASGTYGHLAASVAVGPRIRPNERVTIGLFGRLRIESMTGDLDNDSPADPPSLFYLGLPGAGAAIEVQTTDHLALRLGGDYQHSFQEISTEGPGAGDDAAVGATGDAVSWGFGAAYRDGPYALDMTMTGAGGVFTGNQILLAGSYLFR
jgi:hypothetical protein